MTSFVLALWSFLALAAAVGPVARGVLSAPRSIALGAGAKLLGEWDDSGLWDNGELWL